VDIDINKRILKQYEYSLEQGYCKNFFIFFVFLNDRLDLNLGKKFGKYLRML